jgi:hypothetical protein
MRVPDPLPRSRRLAGPAFLLLMLAAIASSGAPERTAPTLSDYDRFELADVQRDARLSASARREQARRELQMHLRDRLDPWLAERNRRPARATPPRTLRIEPILVAMDPVDPAVRLSVGALAGAGQLRVRVRCVDAATGAVVAETELRASDPLHVEVAGVDAAGSAPAPRIAADLLRYLEAGAAGTDATEAPLPR